MVTRTVKPPCLLLPSLASLRSQTGFVVLALRTFQRPPQRDHCWPVPRLLWTFVCIRSLCIGAWAGSHAFDLQGGQRAVRLCSIPAPSPAGREGWGWGWDVGLGWGARCEINGEISPKVKAAGRPFLLWVWAHNGRARCGDKRCSSSVERGRKKIQFLKSRELGGDGGLSSLLVQPQNRFYLRACHIVRDLENIASAQANIDSKTLKRTVWVFLGSILSFLSCLNWTYWDTMLLKILPWHWHLCQH